MLKAIWGKTRNRLFWWLYVAGICAIGYGRMFERLFRASGGSWSQFGPAIGATILAIGLIGWCNDRAVMNVWVWRGVHLVMGLGQLIAVVFAVYLAAKNIYVPAGLMLSVPMVLIPAHLALYQYSYRSSRLWNSA